VPILDAIDVSARLIPKSAAIGLNIAENPWVTNPCPHKVAKLVPITVHQPKNILGGFFSVIKKFLSLEKYSPVVKKNMLRWLNSTTSICGVSS
jgi:hypothetical protein